MNFPPFTYGSTNLAARDAARGVRPCPICLDRVERGGIPMHVAEAVPCACFLSDRWIRNRRGFWSAT